MTVDINKLNDWVGILKKKRIIKFDSHIAKALGYKRATVSQILNGTNPISYKFLKKFKEHYGEYLDDIDKTAIFEERIDDLEAEVRVLKDTLISLAAKIDNRPISLVSAEMDDAVKLRKGKVIAFAPKKVL